MAVQDVGRDHADGHEGCRCRRGLGEGERGPSLRWRPWEHRGGHRLDMAARDGRGGCHIELIGLLDGCVATTASDAVECACKQLQGSFCSAVTWPISPFGSVNAADAIADIHISSCTPLVQLGLELRVPNHS